jgi:hypothetical protein
LNEVVISVREKLQTALQQAGQVAFDLTNNA